MPNRDIRESALTSTTLYRLSDGAERLFWRLTLIADDYGRFEADPQILKAKCFPRWPDAKMAPSRIGHLYGELEAVELVVTYLVKGNHYGYFPTWERHQGKPRAKASKYPDPNPENICSQPSANVPVLRSSFLGTPTPRSPEPTTPPPNGAAPGTTTGPTVEFRTPASVLSALDRAPTFGAVMRLRDPVFWQAEIRANPGVDFAAEVLKAEAWVCANPRRAPRKDPARFLHGWFSRADREALP